MNGEKEKYQKLLEEQSHPYDYDSTVELFDLFWHWTERFAGERAKELAFTLKESFELLSPSTWEEYLKDYNLTWEEYAKNKK